MEQAQATITALGESTPFGASFLCTGHAVNGEFIPDQVCLITGTLEDQEAVQAFLSKHGLRGDLNQT